MIVSFKREDWYDMKKYLGLCLACVMILQTLLMPQVYGLVATGITIQADDSLQLHGYEETLPFNISLDEDIYGVQFQLDMGDHKKLKAISLGDLMIEEGIPHTNSQMVGMIKKEGGTYFVMLSGRKGQVFGKSLTCSIHTENQYTGEGIGQGVIEVKRLQLIDQQNQIIDITQVNQVLQDNYWVLSNTLYEKLVIYNEKVSALPQLEALTLDDAPAVQELRGLYDAIEAIAADNIALIEFPLDEAGIEAYEAKLVSLSQGAFAVEEAIASFMEVNQITLGDTAAINQIEADYNALSEAQQNIITSTSKSKLQLMKEQLTVLSLSMTRLEATKSDMETALIKYPLGTGEGQTTAEDRKLLEDAIAALITVMEEKDNYTEDAFLTHKNVAREALTAFQQSVITETDVLRKELQAQIELATNKHDAAVPITDNVLVVGHYMQVDIDAYKLVIDKCQLGMDNPSMTNLQLYSLIVEIEEATALFEQQAILAVDVARANIKATIDQGKTLIASTSYGENQGQVPMIQKYILLDAIQAAENLWLYSNDEETLVTGRETLLIAMNAFNQAKILSVDLLEERTNKLYVGSDDTTLSYNATLEEMNSIQVATDLELGNSPSGIIEARLLAVKSRVEQAISIYQTPKKVLLYSDTSLSYIMSGKEIQVKSRVLNTIDQELNQLTINYASSDSAIAQFDSDTQGLLVTKNEGACTITVTVEGTENPVIQESRTIQVYNLPDMVVSNIPQGARYKKSVVVTAYRESLMDIRISHNGTVLVSGSSYVSHTFTEAGTYEILIESGIAGEPNYNKATLRFTIDKIAPHVAIPTIDNVEGGTITIPQVNYDVDEDGDIKKTNLYLEQKLGNAYVYLRKVDEGDTVDVAGDYRLVAYAVDTAGNEGRDWEEFAIIMDQGQPTILVTGIEDIHMSSVTPHIELTGGSNLANYYYIAKVIKPSGEVMTTSENNLTFTEKGKYNLSIEAYNPNALYKVATYTKDFMIDLTDPTITLQGLDISETIYNYDVAPLVRIADDDGLLSQGQLYERAVCTLTKDGVPISFINGSSLGEGAYVLTVTATDLANRQATMTKSFVVDKTAPTLNIMGGTDGAVYQEEVTLTITTDSGEMSVTNEKGEAYTITNNQLLLTGIEGESKAYSIIAMATDEAFNKTLKKITITIDRLPVTFIIDGIYEGQIVSSLPTGIQCKVQDGNLEKLIEPTITKNDQSAVGTPGAHALTLSYVKGNQTYEKELNFVIDPTPPELLQGKCFLNDQEVNDVLAGKEGDTLRVRVRVLDEETAIKQVYASIGHLATHLAMTPSDNNPDLYEVAYPLGQGNYKNLPIKVVAMNEAGLVTTDNIHYLTLDNTAPVVHYHVTPVNLPDGLNGYFTNPHTKVSFSGGDQTAKIYYKLNDQEYSLYTSPLVLPEGEHRIGYYAEDAVGNVMEARSRTIRFDKTKPYIPVHVKPMQNTVLREPRVTITGKIDSEIGRLSKVYVKANDLIISQGMVLHDGTFQLEQVSLGEGPNQLQVYGVDEAGNQGEAYTLNLTVDTTEPILTVTKEGYIYKVSSNEAITSMTATMNGRYLVEKSVTSDNKLFTYEIQPSDLIDGKNEFVANGYDEAGYVGKGTLSTNYIPPALAQEDVPVMEGMNMDIPTGTFDNITLLTVQTVETQGNLDYKPLGAPILYEFTQEPQQPVIIKSQVGLHLTGVGIMHIQDDGTEDAFILATVGAIDMEQLEALPVDTPFYDPETGILVYRTANFSTYQQAQDITAPEIHLTIPQDRINGDGEARLSGTLTDQDQEAYISAILIDGIRTDIHLNSPFDYPLNLTDGNHDVTLIATDRAGNERKASVNYQVDKTAPTIDLLGQTTTNESKLDVTFVTSEEVTLMVNGENQGVKMSGDPLTLELKTGLNTFHLIATDGFGNKTVRDYTVTKVENISLTLHTIAPTKAEFVDITGTVSVDASIYMNDQLKLSHVPAGGFTLGNVPLVIGNNTFRIKAVDQSGHQVVETIHITREKDTGGNTGGDTGGNIGGNPGGDTGGHPGGTTGEESSTDTTKQMMDKVTVSKDGGRILFKHSEVEMNIPKASFQNKVNIHVQVLDLKRAEEADITLGHKDRNSNLELQGKIYDLQADQSLEKAIEVRLPIPEDISVTDYHRLGVYRYDEVKGQWRFLGGAVDKEAGQIVVKVEHFSYYAVMSYFKTFDDIQKSWAQAYIETLASRRIINGITASSYAPNDQITRAAFAKLLVTMAGLDYMNTKTIFSDVPDKAWYAGYVRAAYNAGLVTGYANQTFEPDANISREEMVAMVMNLYGYMTGIDYKQVYSGEGLTFLDNDRIQSWAKSPVEGAVTLNIVSGKLGNRFYPKDYATRGEAAKIIKILMDLMEERSQ